MSGLIDHLQTVKADAIGCANETNTLGSMRLGLYLLAATVRSYEEPLRQLDSARSARISSFGEDPRVPLDQRLVLPCIFHWFAVTACNYARLVGFVRGLDKGDFSKADLGSSDGKKKIKESCSAYVRSVSELRLVCVWRNKIAAHLAITDPRDEDNIATLELSAFYPVGYDNGRFCVHPITLAMTGPDGFQHPSKLPCWSLTETWVALRPRYWPDLALQQQNEKGS